MIRSAATARPPRTDRRWQGWRERNARRRSNGRTRRCRVARRRPAPARRRANSYEFQTWRLSNGIRETLRPTRVGPLGFTLPVEALANDDLWFAARRRERCSAAVRWTGSPRAAHERFSPAVAARRR